MTWYFWLPFYLGIGLLLMVLPLISLFPQTAVQAGIKHSDPDDEASERSPLLGETRSSSVNTTKWSVLLKLVLNEIFAELKALRDLIVGRHNFQLLLGVFILSALASSSMAMLVRYISKRFQWTFAKVSTAPVYSLYLFF